MNEIKVITRAFEAKEYSADNPLPLQISEPTNPERVIRFKASDDSLDRHNEVILPEGWVFTDFVKNPVMMQFHDYSTWPIGKVIAVGVLDNALYVDGEFDPPEIDESAEMIFQKIKHGSVRAGSVGFIPKEIAVPAEGTRSLFDRYPKAKRIYSKQELLEWTICPIPANPNALAAGLQKSYEERFGSESVEVETALDEAPDMTAVALKVWDISRTASL
jgi:phage head maturation protease